MNKVIVTLVILICTVTTVFASEAGVHWAYSGDGGPQHWGELSEEFSTCDDGEMQSPINIVQTAEVRLNPIEFNYQDTSVYVLNNGHTIQLHYAAGSILSIGEKTFSLKQVHFHSPSENRVYGRSFPMEAHFVHADDNGKLLVVSLMFVVGRPNKALDPIWQATPSLANSDMIIPCSKVNVSDLLPNNSTYFAFEGSLTTPPCTEGVQWIVLKQPVEASMPQLKKLRAILDGKNNRPVQPTNGRDIY